jgi:hypothetical protein
MSQPTFLRRAALANVLACAAAWTLTPARADERAGGVPREVYAACASKAEGSACTVETKGAHARTMQGVCAPDRVKQQLACRPAPPRS